MIIPLDAFAGMLGMTPRDLKLAVCRSREINGIQLPGHKKLLGAVMMFDEAEAEEFSRLWYDRLRYLSASKKVTSITLCEFAKIAGVAPLALYHAVTAGRKLRGITPPSPEVKGKQLLFVPDEVESFVLAYRAVINNLKHAGVLND